MGKYTNQIDITSARRLNIPYPADDRVIFHDLSDIQTDLAAPLYRYTAWYNGLVAYIHDLHGLYVWRLSDNIANGLHPEEVNPNAHIDYSAALMPDDFRYPLGFPNASYAGYYFNWYPFPTGGSYSNSDPVSASNLEGWPVGTVPGTKSFQVMWDSLLYPYQPPLITLSANPFPGYREKGVGVLPLTLSTSTIKKKLAITAIEYFKDGVSIHENIAPNPNGGDDFYSTSGFGTGIPNPPDVNFQATVTDGQTVVQSNTLWYRFVYPFYVGNLVSTTPTEANVKSLTKLVVPKQNISHVFNFTQQRYIFAYPQSYGLLDHILDTNLFETIDDYDLQTASYTMLDGAVVPYYIYIFNPYNAGLLTDAVNFTNTFQF